MGERLNRNKTTLGFLGVGNMGGALARAAAKVVSPDRIFLSNRTPAKAETLAAELHCAAADNLTVAKTADYLFLGVKPQMMAELLEEIAPALHARQGRFLLVSMVAGLSIERIQELAGGDYPVIRIMPNTPVSIGEGMILYACSESVTPEELADFREMMSKAGLLSPLAESLMAAGGAVAGCGPAFVDLFLEALADGGVACGLSRKQALEFAAQMTVGAARLLLETKEHPGALKDAVCSPAGSTIQGVRKLEEAGFRGAVINAVIAAEEVSRNH